MSSGNVIASNFTVQSVLDYWRGVLTAGSTLRLFSNNPGLSPATVWSNLVECTFTGYAAKSLSGLFQVPTSPSLGEYLTAVVTQTFSCTGGGGQTAYGAAILDAALNLRFVWPFAAPIVFLSGQSWAIQVSLFEWAASQIP